MQTWGSNFLPYDRPIAVSKTGPPHNFMMGHKSLPELDVFRLMELLALRACISILRNWWVPASNAPLSLLCGCGRGG